MVRPVVVRGLLALVVALALTGFFVHHSACVAGEESAAGSPVEKLFTVESRSTLPTADEIDASEPSASPALTR